MRHQLDQGRYMSETYDNLHRVVVGRRSGTFLLVLELLVPGKQHKVVTELCLPCPEECLRVGSFRLWCLRVDIPELRGSAAALLVEMSLQELTEGFRTVLQESPLQQRTLEEQSFFLCFQFAAAPEVACWFRDLPVPQPQRCHSKRVVEMK